MSKYSDAAINADEAMQTLAIEYVPIQETDFSNVFSSDDALMKGTVFPELFLPFCRERGVK